MPAMLFTLLLIAAAAAAAVWFCLAFRKDPDRGPGYEALLTIAAALLLFWFVETGVQRRVFGVVQLFRFAEEGVYLPGRAAVLLVCVLVCFLLGLTGPGRRFRAGIGRLDRKNGMLWLMSLAVTALFFLWACRITVVHFMTNDDTTILRQISNTAVSGLSAARHSFASVLFCGLIGLFYRIDPEGWWYAWYHLAMIFASCTIVGRCILLKTRRRGWSPLWGCLIAWVLFCGVMLPPLAELSFTITPAIAGTAAAALLFCRDDESVSRAGRAVSDVGTVILILLCYLQRSNTGKALLCFIALVCVYQIVRLLRARRPDRYRQLIGLCVTAAAALVLIAGCHAAASSDDVAETDSSYWNAEYYRSIVMDYLNGKLTAEQLEVVGIPPELANLLLLKWYFMDERINTDTFRQLTELYYYSDPAEGGGGLLASLSSSFKDAPAYIPSLWFISAAGFLLLLLGAVRFLRCGRKFWLEFLCALCAFGGAAVLLLYIMLSGRLMFRAFLVVAIPALTLMLLACLTGPDGEEPPRRRFTTSAAAVLTAAICVLCALVVYHVPYAAEYASRDTVFEAQSRTEAWANAHPDTLFITNFASQNLDPFHSGSYPSNMRLWGGTGVTAQAPENRLYADAFFRDDVRFMCEKPGTVLLLMQYLTLDHGPVSALDEAHLTDNIYVFDMSQIRPDDGADGWYDWNGVRFYFRDGQALTGTQIIDGVEYEFAPAGAASFMFSVETDEGSYFLTYAYSLTEEP